MVPALLLLAAAALGAPEEAGSPPGGEDAPRTTISATGGYSTVADPDSDEDLESTSGGVGVSWTSGGVTLGGAVSSLDASTLPPEYATASDGNGVTASAFIGWSAGDYDLDVSIGYAQQTLEGTSVIADDGPPALAGREVNVDGETRSSSVSLGASRTFDFDTTWLTPHARLAWDQAESEASAALAGGGSGLQSSSDASGVSFAAGVEAGAYLADWLSVFVDVTGVTSSNEAANVIGLGGRATRPVSGEDEESGTWAEISAGLTIEAASDVSLGLVAGGSAGRQEDDVFGSLTLSKSF